MLGTSHIWQGLKPRAPSASRGLLTQFCTAPILNQMPMDLPEWAAWRCAGALDNSGVFSGVLVVGEFVTNELGNYCNYLGINERV